MIISLYQNNPRFGETGQNIEEIIDNLKGINFDLLVLPELFATGYQFKDREEAISLADTAGEGLTFEMIKKFAAEKDAGSLIFLKLGGSLITEKDTVILALWGVTPGSGGLLGSLVFSPSW